MTELTKGNKETLFNLGFNYENDNDRMIIYISNITNLKQHTLAYGFYVETKEHLDDLVQCIYEAGYHNGVKSVEEKSK